MGSLGAMRTGGLSLAKLAWSMHSRHIMAASREESLPRNLRRWSLCAFGDAGASDWTSQADDPRP
jgi:hypothetical protein